MSEGGRPGEAPRCLFRSAAGSPGIPRIELSSPTSPDTSWQLSAGSSQERNAPEKSLNEKTGEPRGRPGFEARMT